MKDKLQQTISATDGEHQLQNVSGKFKIKTTIQKIINRLSFKIRTSYIYYYYICLKEFINKLLNPKKMIIVKWRINIKQDFKYLTYVENDKIFKATDIIDCSENPQKFVFRIKTPSKLWEIIPLSCFYIINPNTIYWFNHDKMKWVIDNGEILEYQYDSKIIKFDLNNLIKDSNTYFYYNQKENSIIKIDGVYCDFCNENQDNLIVENVDKFIDFSRI